MKDMSVLWVFMRKREKLTTVTSGFVFKWGLSNHNKSSDANRKSGMQFFCAIQSKYCLHIERLVFSYWLVGKILVVKSHICKLLSVHTLLSATTTLLNGSQKVERDNVKNNELSQGKQWGRKQLLQHPLFSKGNAPAIVHCPIFGFLLFLIEKSVMDFTITKYSIITPRTINV